MLTFIEAISLAGDRAKQNDDACGFSSGRAWVIDGATDLHNTPLTHVASDASWIAHFANARFAGAADHSDLKAIIRDASAAAAQVFSDLNRDRSFERWQSPIASLLMVHETHEGLGGVDLGDCRMFALEADGAVQVEGGPGDAGATESKRAAQQTDAHKPLLERTQTIAMLRQHRAMLNREGAHWTFGLDPACADHARAWMLTLKRPAHVLLMTDGFAALTDRYDAYGPGDLVQAALTRGLQELGRELRAIEAADQGGAEHPRFKANDDATALLMRLS